MIPRPDLRTERSLLRAGARVVVGMDEVGRGALAGPVSVGAVAVDLATRACPRGVADSKLLSPAAREHLLPGLRGWGVARAVGHAAPEEIDSIGIIAALRLAGRRALAGLGVDVDVVLLDGSHDWLTHPVQLDLFSADDDGVGPGGASGSGPVLGDGASSHAGRWPDGGTGAVAVRTRVKADRTCASVAAASVLAKCERDALMVSLAEVHPGYGWAENKGYGAPEHVDALRGLGPTPLHRRSWRLPSGDDVVAGPGAAGPGAMVGPGVGGTDGAGRWAMMDW